MIDVHVYQLYHVLMAYFPKQHDFADGSGGDAIAILGLLEFFDGDGLALI